MMASEVGGKWGGKSGVVGSTALTNVAFLPVVKNTFFFSTQNRPCVDSHMATHTVPDTPTGTPALALPPLSSPPPPPTPPPSPLPPPFSPTLPPPLHFSPTLPPPPSPPARRSWCSAGDLCNGTRSRSVRQGEPQATLPGCG